MGPLLVCQVLREGLCLLCLAHWFALCVVYGDWPWAVVRADTLIHFHFCLASTVCSLSASLSLSHCTLSRRASARMSFRSCVSRSWSWAARASERCWMSSHVAWVIHGCLGVDVSAGTCMVHACWTAGPRGALSRKRRRRRLEVWGRAFRT